MYKRQEPDRVVNEIEDVIGLEAHDAPRISAKTGLNVEEVLEPVSYTHLDVYKRQDGGFLLSFGSVIGIGCVWPLVQEGMDVLNRKKRSEVNEKGKIRDSRYL